MITNPTNEHGEQPKAPERLIVCTDTSGGKPAIADWAKEHMKQCDVEYVRADLISSRDTEIREVLEGLASKVYISFRGEYCWCRRAGLATRPEGDNHDLHCQRTRGLYAKLQPKESSDVDK